MASLDRSNRRGFSRRHTPGTMSDINVTPMVDIMSVLLIVFMITAPMLTAGVEVDLPKAGAKAISQKDNNPLEITVSRDGKIYMGETEVRLERLKGILRAIAVEGKNRKVYIEADMHLSYGIVMEVMGAVSSSGFTRIALVTDPASMEK